MGTDPRPAHLVLVGLPGAGKSTVGRLVAERLDRSFLDFDVELERRQGRSIAEIFGVDGEPHFRLLERALTAELREGPAMVLAPGGGWITQPDVVEMLRPPASLVYLRVHPERALDRLGDQRATRPLLRRPDPAAEMSRLLDARRRAYEGADEVVDTDVVTLSQVVDAVVELGARLLDR